MCIYSQKISQILADNYETQFGVTEQSGKCNAERKPDSNLQEAKHHRQDVLGMWTKVFICWDAVDDFQHQLSQLLHKWKTFLT